MKNLMMLPVGLILLVLLLVAGADGYGDGEGLGTGTPPAPEAGTLDSSTIPDWAVETLTREGGSICPEITSLVLAGVIQQESMWDGNAVSPDGARGYMQFMPDTWTERGADGNGDGIKDPTNFDDAVRSGNGYLCFILDMYRERIQNGLMPSDTNLLDATLSGYNAGPWDPTILTTGRPNQTTENQEFAAKVREHMARFSNGGGGGGVVAGAWTAPMGKNYALTTKIGVYPASYGALAGKNHFGQDLNMRAVGGGPIVAAGTGRITAIGNYGSAGLAVVISHGNGIYTRYFHLSSFAPLVVGDVVTAGTKLGMEGNTGVSFNPHLHYEVVINGRAVDPIAWHIAVGAPLDGKGSGETPAPLDPAAKLPPAENNFARSSGIGPIPPGAAAAASGANQPANDAGGGGGTAWSVPFKPQRTVTSERGHRCLNGVCRMHEGTDIGAPQGTPILAVCTGKVEFLRDFGDQGLGILTVQRCANGVRVYYGHQVSRASGITVGKRYEAGTTIGYVGDTGASFGAHLHLEIHENPGSGWYNGTPVDPRVYLREKGVSF